MGRGGCLPQQSPAAVALCQPTSGTARAQGAAIGVFCDTNDPKPPQPRPHTSTPPLPDEQRAPRRVLRPNLPATAAFALH